MQRNEDFAGCRTQLAESVSILRLSRVSKNFIVGGQEIPVLKNISLSLHAGSMVAIVGTSGSGKSTLLNILGCLDRPTSGAYRVSGRDTASLDGDRLAKLRRRYFGFIFQRYHLLPNLSARENVEMPAIYAGMPSTERESRAIELLGRLGLDERTEHRPNQLSGGQQQRVGIARALINGGKVILADEPTGALDSDSGREVLQILLDLHAEGHTVIVVTHDMNVAAYAQRIIEMRDGRIVSDSANLQGPAGGTSVPQADGKRRRRKRYPSPSAVRHLMEAMTMAWAALTSHRLRTALTMLGIVIGISSVVSIIGIGEGGKRHLQETIGRFATSIVEVHRGNGWNDAGAVAVHTLLPGDVDALREQPYVDSVSPLTRTAFTVRYGGADVSATVNGVGAEHFRVRGVSIAEGRAFGEEDVRGQSQVVVINPEARQKLFPPTEDPIGKAIIIGSVPCIVIGVTGETTGSLNSADGPDFLVPYTTAGIRLFGQQHFDSITVRLRDKQDSNLGEQAITNLLSYRHRDKDFFINNMDTLAKAYANTSQSLALMLLVIAAIALVVGGIGVMNIMLVSVTERTREIGIRIALGARSSDIMKQFVAEAVVICLIGGVLGVALAILGSYAFAALVKDWRMVLTPGSVAMAFLCSTFIGLTFGFMPARKAARMNPNDALARD
jgi:macrolide transport system ATP-binding/permease protein